MKIFWRPLSVKAYLLAWIIVPITVFIVIDSFALYRNTLESANTAYDRMLVTTAYSIGDSLRIDNKRLQIPVSYAALEVHEAEYSTRAVRCTSSKATGRLCPSRAWLSTRPQATRRNGRARGR